MNFINARIQMFFFCLSESQSFQLKKIDVFESDIEESLSWIIKFYHRGMHYNQIEESGRNQQFRGSMSKQIKKYFHIGQINFVLQNSHAFPKIVEEDASLTNSQVLKQKEFTTKKNEKKFKADTSPLKKSGLITVSSLKSSLSSKEEKQNKFTSLNIEQIIYGNVSNKTRNKFLHCLYKGVFYAMQRLKVPSLEFVQQHSVFLNQPTDSHKKFLLLDLDETLIYTQKNSNISKNGSKVSFKISIRPYVYNFLKEMSTCYQIYLFTAAKRSYAQAAIEKLNRKKVYIKDFLCRQNCFETKKGVFLKDLRIIKNRTLEDIVIVDNLVESFGLQLDNGIPILQFKGEQDDQQLLGLIPILKQISKAEDVRTVIKQRYNLKQFYKGQAQEIDNLLKTK